MRVKQKVDARTQCPVLTVELDKGAELDYEDSSIIMGGTPPFALMQVNPREKAPTLTYQLGPEDLPLDKLLQQSLDLPTLSQILASFAGLVECSEFYSLSLQRVMLDPAKIYCNRLTGALTFIYVPSRAFVDVENDIRGTLVYVCRTAKPLHRSFRDVLARIEDNILRSAMFTAVDYRRLLRSLNLDSAMSNQSTPAQGAQHNTTTFLNESRASSFGFDFVQEQERAQEAAMEAARIEAAFSPSTSGVGTHQSAVIITHVGSGASWSLGEGAYTIGRAPESSIVLGDVDGVSRRHATLIVNGGATTIRDENSTNGIKVNGSRIPPMVEVPIQPGDMILIGRGAFSLARA